MLLAEFLARTLTGLTATSIFAANLWRPKINPLEGFNSSGGRYVLHQGIELTLGVLISLF